MVQETPKISVVIPAYNAEATIVRACRSVLTQSYPNVELIVVNDGSRDGTAGILDQLAAQHDNLQVIHKENGGVCTARNAGLAAAQGDYLCFLDADDELTEGCIAYLYGIAAEKNCDIVAGSCLRIRRDGSSFETKYDLPEEMTLWQGLEGLEQSLKDHPATYSVWGKLYRREILRDVKFVEGRKIHEDSFFLFQVLMQPLRMAVTNVPIVRYYLTENSASRAGFSEKFLDVLYFADRKRELVEETYPQFLALAKNVQVKACLTMLNVMRTGYDPKFKPVERQCIATVHQNANYYIPAIRTDRILFRIVRLRLYPLFKLAFQTYQRIRK